MNKPITASYIIPELEPGGLVTITLSNLGTRVATIQFEDANGFHDIPETDATSIGDTFAKTVQVGVYPNPKAPFARLNVSLTAGVAEVVELTWSPA